MLLQKSNSLPGLSPLVAFLDSTLQRNAGNSRWRVTLHTLENHVVGVEVSGVSST